ncbi:MAG: outer membrane beta-barrel protein [Leptolyngbya sp. BL-A-14]
MRVPLLVLCPLAALAPCQAIHAAVVTDTDNADTVSVDVAPSAASREIVAATTIAPQLRAIAAPETIPPQVTNPLEPRSNNKPSNESGAPILEQRIHPSIATEPALTVVPTPTKPEADPAEIPSQNAIAPSQAIPLTPLQKVPSKVVPSDAIPPVPVETQPAESDPAQASGAQVAVSQSAIDLLPPEQVAQLSPTDGLTEPGHNPIDEKPEPSDPEDTKDELGEVRILRRPTQQPTPRPQPDVQLLLRSGIFSSSNISALETFQPSDVVFSNTGLLLATPKLGPTTRLVAAAGGGAIRFATEGDFNYNVLNFNVGIQQRLTDQMYAQVGWVNEQLYRDGSGQRLLLDNAVDFTIGRQDQLGKQLRLDSFYNLRASFTNPTDQSRVANTLGARLRYDFTPAFQGSLDYRLTFKNFTDVDRFDTEHQISATATYSINPNLFIAGSVSYLFGNSSNSAIDVNNLSIGVVVGMNIPFGF